MFLKLRKRRLSKQIKRFNSQITYYQKKIQFMDAKELYKSRKKITTSKLVLGVLLASFFCIQIFTAWATIKAIELATITGIMDWTPLVTLIGSIAGSVVSLLGYYAKSAKENTTGGIVYDSAMMQYNAYYYNNNIEDGVSVG